MKWYVYCLKNYGNFNGRARRTEYWMFALFNGLFITFLSLLWRTLGKEEDEFSAGTIFAFLRILYTLFIFIPGLAVTVRRLHDVGKSGYFLFIGLIPIIGWVWLFVLYLKDSQVGDNEYGPNPKGINAQ